MQIINSKVATSSGTHRAFLVQMEQFTQTETWRSMIPASSSTIILSNCTVNKTTYNRNLVTQNTVTKSFILALNHMSTQNCNAEYDSAGYLTPNLQTPSPSKKQKLYCSCECLFYQSPLRDFFSLTCVLIFNFIYPCSSNHH